MSHCNKRYISEEISPWYSLIINTRWEFWDYTKAPSQEGRLNQPKRLCQKKRQESPVKAFHFFDNFQQFSTSPSFTWSSQQQQFHNWVAMVAKRLQCIGGLWVQEDGGGRHRPVSISCRPHKHLNLSVFFFSNLILSVFFLSPPDSPRPHYQLW